MIISGWDLHGKAGGQERWASPGDLPPESEMIVTHYRKVEPLKAAALALLSSHCYSLV